MCILNSHAVVDCGKLPFVFGIFSTTETTAGTTVRYTCFEGYTLFGAAERTCQPNGLWSGEQTRCESKSKIYLCSIDLLLAEHPQINFKV